MSLNMVLKLQVLIPTTKQYGPICSCPLKGGHLQLHQTTFLLQKVSVWSLNSINLFKKEESGLSDTTVGLT